MIYMFNAYRHHYFLCLILELYSDYKLYLSYYDYN